jgi:hypothetical protein
MSQTFQSANTDDFRRAMKDNYGPGLRNSLNSSNVAWEQATPNSDDIIGLKAVWAVHSGRSSATGNAAELGALPTADRQRFIRPEKALAYMYHTIKVSGPVRHLTRGNEGAFAQALETEIKGAEKDLKHDLNRQVFNGVVIQNSVYVSGAIGNSAATAKGTDDFTLGSATSSELRAIFPGMKLDSITPATGAVSEAAMVVVSVNRTTKVVTVDDTGAMASGDFVVRSGSNGAEIDGLRGLLSAQKPDATNDYDYAGVDVSANLSWLAQQVGSTTEGISEVLLDEAVEAVETDGDGSSPELFIAEHIQRRKLASMLQAQKRYDGRQMTLTSGWTGLQLARGVLVADRFCPSTYIFGLHKPELTKFVGLDFQWDDDDGDVFFKSGTDAIEARYKGYHQLAVTNRNSHVQIRVAEPTF